MAIHFTQERWSILKDTYARWWNGTLSRPLVQLTVADAYVPDRPEPQAPLLCQSSCHRLDIPAEEIIDRLDYELSRKKFLGDAFPRVNFDCFGPGVLSAFCGARLDNSSGAVWFFPQEPKEIAEISVRYDPENVWVRRIKDLYRAGNERWNGQVLMGMPDLGGILDVAAVFRGSEELMYDLFDEPEEVLRLCGEIETAWLEAFSDLNSVLSPACPGYSDWLGIYSEKPSYVLQSDFSYMTSNEMFREFALPGLERLSAAIPNTVYHLDGVGQLPHLDDLLTMKDIAGIQWVAGAGKPGAAHWPEVYQKIAAAGKGCKVEGTPEEFHWLTGQVSQGLAYNLEVYKEWLEDVLRFLGPHVPR